MKTGFLSLTLGLLMVSPAQAQAPSRLVERLLQSDTNGDGKISSDEAPERMKQNFARVDGNSDGFVDRDELIELGKKLGATKGNPAGNRRAATPLPEGVTLREDVAYREGNPKWTLDLYLPEGPIPESGRPGLVVVHGGGWRNGDKKGGIWSSIPGDYAARGYVAIGVNYRLYPEVGMLDCIADVKCAVRWLRSHAEEFGLDPNRIGAYGNSAGAHLVSILGLTGSEAELEGDGPYPDQSSQVQAVCASATPSDFLHWGTKGPGDFPMLAEGEGTIEERAGKASPISYVTGNAPPFLLVHAKDDRTVPYRQGQSLMEKLESAGAKVTWMSYDDGGHGVYNAKLRETAPAMEAFFDRSLSHK